MKSESKQRLFKKKSGDAHGPHWDQGVPGENLPEVVIVQNRASIQPFK
jgi:hypothetical protein